MKDKITFLVAVMACGLGLWSLVKLNRVENRIEEQIARIDDTVVQATGSLNQSFKNIQAQSDSKNSDMADYEQSLSDSARNVENQWQDISFLKSERLNHDKRIDQLFNEVLVLRRNNNRLKSDVSRLRSDVDRIRR